MVFKEHAGGLPAMREAARNADLFVIVTGAAKHAATTFIETNRPKELPTVYPKGQGSSSILTAIRSWISEIS